MISSDVNYYYRRAIVQGSCRPSLVVDSPLRPHETAGKKKISECLINGGQTVTWQILSLNEVGIETKSPR